jgi:hypothetical protein
VLQIVYLALFCFAVLTAPTEGKRGHRGDLLAFIKCLINMTAVFCHATLTLWISKGYPALRSKISRQEARVTIGVAAFDAISEMTWLSILNVWNVNMSIVGTLLPFTYNLLTLTYGLTCAIRLHRIVQKYSRRLDKTLSAVQLLDSINNSASEGQMRHQQQLVVQKYRYWRQATLWTIRILLIALVSISVTGSLIMSIPGKLSKFTIEITLLQPARLIIYLFAMWAWRPLVFPKD